MSQYEHGDQDLRLLLKDNPLFVFALPQEAADAFSGYNLLFTGVGKINAAYALTKALTQHSYSIIVNLGSAGSYRHKRGEVVCCQKFIQRDMDVTALGFEMYQTPFGDDPTILDNGQTHPSLPVGTCGTGDSFETNVCECCYDVLDMEAYSLALTAKREHMPFLCLKYITDGADGSAGTDWNTTLHLAAMRLRSTIDNLKNF